MDYKKLMKDKNLDGMLITNIINVRYYTGFTGTEGTILITKKSKYFLTDSRYRIQAKKELNLDEFKIIEVERSLTVEDEVSKLLAFNNVKKLGIEDKSITLFAYNSYISKFENVDLVSLDDNLTRTRMIKTEDEINKIRKAAEIGDIAFQKIIPLIKEGILEKDIKIELEYEMKKLGADGPSFDIIIASNERSAMPHGVASDKKIEKEGFVKFDFGCFYRGYASDMTRTIYYGENPTKEHLDIYKIVLKAQLKAIKAIKAGVNSRDLDKIARDYITKKGYGDKFKHGLGHGVGLEIHEYPNVSGIAENFVLEENMVITIEPGIYIDGFGGVRIEDDIVVKKDGYEILNRTPKELMIIK